MYYLGHDGSRDFPAKFFFLEMATFIFREIPGKSGSYSMISIFQDKIKQARKGFRALSAMQGFR